MIEECGKIPGPFSGAMAKDGNWSHVRIIYEFIAALYRGRHAETQRVSLLSMQQRRKEST